MTDLLDLHGQAVVEFDQRVRAVGARQWGNATPCRKWNVHDLVNHLVSEQLWVPHLLGGGTIAEAGSAFGGDQLGDRPVAAWEAAARAARVAWLAPGALERTVHLSYGEVPATHYAWEMTADLTVHAWDLARGIGAEERLAPDLVARVLEWSLPRAAGLAASGLFDPPVPVGDDADSQTRLLALYGRRAGTG